MASNRCASSVSSACKPLLQLAHTLALIEDVRLVLLLGLQNVIHKLFTDLRCEPCEKLPGELSLLVERDAEAEAELGVVFEERVAPCRTATFGVLRPGRRRQVAAVNRRAPGRVGDDQPVAKKLRKQFQIRRLAATCARPGELKQRLLHLLRTDVFEADSPTIQFGNREKEAPVLPLRLAKRRLRPHVNRLQPRLRFVARRTDINADAAARTILDRDLQRVAQAPPIGQPRLARLERCRRGVEHGRRIDFAANHRMRTHHHALVALDTDIRIPDRHLCRQVALFPSRGAGRERSVARESAHRHAVAAAGDH